MTADVDSSRETTLSLATLDRAAARPGVTGPTMDPRELTVGLVHLGLGAFHRAHQAVFTEDAATATGQTRWGILGVTGRSAAVADQLAPQDGLYSVLTRSPRQRSLRIMGSLRAVAFPGRDTERVVDALAAPGTAVVSTTITEKGYPRTGTGGLDCRQAGVGVDIDALRQELLGQHVEGAAATALGLLARGLGRRFRLDGGPLTVVPCDNLPSNGRLTRTLLTDFAEQAGGGRFQDWLQESVAFAGTMVDRIVPATAEADRRETQKILGMADHGLVVAEPFGQWVIEDNFAGARPAWEQAGATVTRDVEPFEVAKLRMLNATHSLLAYLGALRGFATIAEAVSDPALLDAARRLQREDVIPTLEAPEGMDLPTYGESILDRFANPALGHTTVQVAMDGSEKLPIRVLGTVADRLAAGAVPEAAALAVAAWMVFVHRGRDVDGRDLALNDPLGVTLRATAAGPDAGLSARMFALAGVFPRAVAEHDGFRDAVGRHVQDLLHEVR
ncbi:mannitol dehydrogenase family protein [Arthrobacter dokdonensis]|uniref:mannitol dehydrogenase family protein n=1 Tax=Arthrobacter dokdonellae TaxID=2211210 RepID=UPI000DE59300|nr:mannitol dehydrogenase family protein [Arthrobacter dokdonellae]